MLINSYLYVYMLQLNVSYDLLVKQRNIYNEGSSASATSHLGLWLFSALIENLVLTYLIIFLK